MTSNSFQTKHASQVMVFGLVASNGLKMPPVFLPSGFRMGAKEYSDKVLRPHVLPWVQADFGNNQNKVPMQSKVPCYTANSVQKVTREHQLLGKGFGTLLTRLESSGLQHIGSSSGIVV